MPLSDDEREKLAKMLSRFNQSDKPAPKGMTKARSATPKPTNFSEAMMKRLRDENRDVIRESHLIRGTDNCCPNNSCERRDGMGVVNVKANPNKDIPEHLGIAIFNEHLEEANVIFVGLEDAKRIVNQLTVSIALAEQAAGINLDPFKKADC